MVKSKKKIIIISGILLLAIMFFSVLKYYENRVYWKYNDKWILGKNKEKIVERYGEFDLRDGKRYGYFLYKDNKSFMGMSGSGDDMYYYIVFDENDIAIRIYVSGTTGG